MKDETILLRVAPQMKEDLKNLAEASGLSMSDYIRFIIRDKIRGYSDKDEKEIVEVKSNLDCNDVLQYYLGCRFIYTFNSGEVVFGKLEQASINDWYFSTVVYLEDEQEGDMDVMDVRKEGKIMLILTDPTDMNMLQRKTYKSLCYECRDTAGDLLRIVDTPQSLHFLFRNGVDAFDLIEKGLAIDSKNFNYDEFRNKYLETIK